MLNKKTVDHFHLLSKPIGPLCNLDCNYCFYTEKEALFNKKTNYQISDDVLENYIKKYIESQQSQNISFLWQGGEPTLLGIDFYEKVVLLQNKYANGKLITNSLQTNGTLIDEKWCLFFKKYNFLIGISLDGTEEIHDRYRVDCGGKSTFYKVIRGLKFLQEYDIEYNVLVCVTKESVNKPLEIYNSLKERGVRFIQFIPIVEREADSLTVDLGLRHATPSSLCNIIQPQKLTPWSVDSEGYGDFLIKVFNEWVRKDVGEVHVMNFEWALSSWVGLPASVCIFSKKCGNALVMEHNGDIFSCDHYVYPAHRLGNILDDSLESLVNSDKQIEFGENKEKGLPVDCQGCEFLFACHGECPKHRFLEDSTGEIGLNYLCAGYKKYFAHIDPYMKVLSKFIKKGIPSYKIMDLLN